MQRCIPLYEAKPLKTANKSTNIYFILKPMSNQDLNYLLFFENLKIKKEKKKNMFTKCIK